MADDIAKMGREALEESWTYDRDNRKEMLEDLKFIAGFQWPDTAQKERQGRPMITINRTGQFLRQVSNPIRQNMPVLKCQPIDDRSDENLTEIYNGLFRQIQYNSSAAHVYAAAVEHAVGCGIGWFRALTDYLDEESFDQELMIKRIANPMTVYPDPSSTEPDRSTMTYCLVSELMPLKAFKARWPKASTTGLDTPSDQKMQTSTFWQQGDFVRIAEFWRKEETKRTLAKLKNGQTVDLSTLRDDQKSFLEQSGAIVATRDSKSHKVSMTLISGNEQLEEAYECPCKWIPVIPVIGAEVPQEKGVYRHGLIRFQREPQQLHNYFLSVAAESLGQQPKTPYMVAAPQVLKYKDLWDNANKTALPYLPYTPVDGVPPPQRVAPPPLPNGLLEMAGMLESYMKATTGVYDAALGNRSNETSGVAISARVQQGDQATFHYVDNLEHSLEHLGRIMLDMIPKVYDTERVLRFVSEDGTEHTAEVNKAAYMDNGEPVVINDLSQAKFDIRVVMGPNYATRRAESLAALQELARADPRLLEIGGDIIVRAMDFPGSEELAERYKAILPPQVLNASNPEQAGPPPSDPMQEAMAQMQMAEGEAKVSEAQAKASKAAADAEQSQHRAKGAQIDNALKLRQLSTPPTADPRAGNGAF